MSEASGSWEETVLALEERVAFAEQARDNAITQRDAALERVKLKSASAGKRISALVSLVYSLLVHMDKPTSERAEKQLEIILGKDS